MSVMLFTQAAFSPQQSLGAAVDLLLLYFWLITTILSAVLLSTTREMDHILYVTIQMHLLHHK